MPFQSLGPDAKKISVEQYEKSFKKKSGMLKKVSDLSAALAHDASSPSRNRLSTGTQLSQDMVQLRDDIDVNVKEKRVHCGQTIDSIPEVAPK